MSQALYRKYRSKSLSEIVGQTHVTNVLARALSQGRTTHAYLLTGPRGVGKTSIARILAHEINKLPYNGDTYLDIIEIDAASNNGVEDVRDLRDKVHIAPTSAAKKVYIIDEVHMLSKPAFNALLKTLEEPPEHVVFILATTEVDKLPDTIISRTQRFHFRPIDTKNMMTHLAEIAKKEKITINDDALELIAERADGSFRDGISLLDQLSSSSDKDITLEIAETTLGLASKKTIVGLKNAIMSHDPGTVVSLLGELELIGVSPSVIAKQLGNALRSDIIQHPELITLLESLIDVTRSHDPQLKLLAVLIIAANTGKKPTTIALAAAPSPVITAPARPTATKKSAESSQTEEKETATPKIKETITAKSVNTKTEQTAAVPLEWAKVLEIIRTKHLPLFGIVQRAEATYAKDTLTLHFSYALHKKKLDDGKYRQLLTEVIVELYGATPKIVTTSGKRPPKNEHAAAVAAIMGGGEEVNVS